MNIYNYGFKPETDSDYNGITENIARVTAVYKDRFDIIADVGKEDCIETHARLKSAVYFDKTDEVDFPTVGDFVRIQYNSSGDSIITETMQRRTAFKRRDPDPSGRISQMVATNFDYVFILTSLNHDFNVRRLERYLTITRQSGATPVIILTKQDLCSDYSEHLEKTKKVAGTADICVISSQTGYGMEQLHDYVRPEKTIVLLGSSGVGKSSLINALVGEKYMNVGGIREDDSKGHHTTTHRQLIMLEDNAMLIDTPGMRMLGIWDASEGINETFSDVVKYIGTCKFSDCKHGSEPGCAIKAAIESGELSIERYNSYMKLTSDANHSKNCIKSKAEGKKIAEYQRAHMKTGRWDKTF